MNKTAGVWVLGTILVVALGAAWAWAEGPSGQPGSDQELKSGLKDAARDAQDARDDAARQQDDAQADAPKRPPTPNERRIAEIDELVKKADELRQKLPEVEKKVEKAIGNLVDGSRKPVEERTVREELFRGQPSQAAKQFRQLVLAIVKVHDEIKVIEMSVMKKSAGASKIRTLQPEQKSHLEELESGARKKAIDALEAEIKLFERIHDRGGITACYKQILSLDKENVTARNYFRDLKKTLKEENEARRKAASNSNSDSNGGGYSGTGNHRPSSRGY